MQKILMWNNSCIRKNHDISKSYQQQSSFTVSLGEIQCYLPIGILTSDWGHLSSQATCSLELCEDEHDFIVLLWWSLSFFRWNMSHFWKIFL